MSQPLRPISVRMHHASVINQVGETGGAVSIAVDDEGDELMLDVQIEWHATLENKTTNVMIPWTQLKEVVDFIIPVGHRLPD